MATWQFKGLEEYARYLQRIQANTEETCGAGVYAMAQVIADQVRSNIEALPSIPDPEAIKRYRAGDKAILTAGQKKGLLESFGVSAARNENGYYNVKLGFDGYNTVKTRRYPQGQPNAMIARTVESGSSYMDKHPFIRPATNAAMQRKAIEACKIAIDKRIHEIDD